MKSLIICVIAFSTILVANGAPKDITLFDLGDSPKLFESFVKDFDKDYKTKEEYELRHSYFVKNLQRINELNSEKENTAIFGITKFSDLSADEFKEQFLTLVLPENWNANRSVVYLPHTAPEQLDWREMGAVLPVKYQARCGSCWAFSAIATLEGAYYIKHKKLIALSEQQLVDCDYQQKGCDGGWPHQTLEFLRQSGGSQSEESYPYTAVQGTCNFNQNAVVAKVASMGQVPPDEEQMKEYLAMYGPLSVAVDASRMHHYQGGVDNPQGQCRGPVTHAVNIVGYGIEGGVPFWALRNSWAANYGRQGYYYLVRGQNACSINTHVVSVIAE